MLLLIGTIFNGGCFASVVPSKASAMVDIRLMPSTSVDDILKKIEDITKNVINERNEFYRKMTLDPTSSARLSTSITIINQLPAARIDSNHPLVLSCVNAVKNTLNIIPTSNGCGPANEGYMLIDSGIPTICGFGPIGGNVHGVDEWISIPSMAQTVDIYLDIVSNYCQLFG
jgi:acetylornithine deacetylase/succinyl-diaminopimelate desuccinylase-like protein